MIRILALLLTLTAGAASASDDYDSKSIDSATRDEIKATLLAEGYELRKVEMEDGRFEAYAVKDGARYEIYLDRDLNVTKIEMDD